MSSHSIHDQAGVSQWPVALPAFRHLWLGCPGWLIPMVALLFALAGGVEGGGQPETAMRTDLFPPFARSATGDLEVVFQNPNTFAVAAALRSGEEGVDITIPAGASASVHVRGGDRNVYQLYSIYGNQPTKVEHNDRNKIVLPDSGRVTISLVSSKTALGRELLAHQVLSDPPSSGSLPPFREGLNGRNEVRVRNPNDFSVSVGVRAGGAGRDFEVSANDVKSVYVPDGRYDIYFVYSSDPGALYQGDSFTLQNSGVEIHIVKVTNGNYGIRRVR